MSTKKKTEVTKTEVTKTEVKKTETDASTMPARVAEAVSHIQAAIAALALSTPAVTTRQKKLAAKGRKGSEKVLPTITSLANQYGVNLPLQPTSQMTAQAELVSQLEPLQKSLQAFLASVDANSFVAGSASWGTATTLYTILKKVAKSDPTARVQLAPVETFFAYRHPATRARQKEEREARAAAKEQAVALKADAKLPPVPEPAPAPANGSDATPGNGASVSNTTPPT